MRIVCPSCETAYDVPDMQVTRRRTVRCAHCGREWVNEPPQAQPRADAPPPEAPLPEAAVAETPVQQTPASEALVAEAVPTETAPEPQPQRSWPAPATPEAHADQRVGQPQSRPLAEDDSAVRFAWIASLALLTALALAAWQYREDVMRFWPASKAVYQVLGLTGP